MNPLTQFKKILILPLLIALALVVAAPALATPQSGVTSVAIANGTFADIGIFTRTDIDPSVATHFWQVIIDTKGASHLYVVQNTVVPGGTFGWHSHPGPSLVIVKSGTAMFYMADDPTCSPHVVQAGSGFVDNGHDTHVVRNEGSVDLVTVVVSLVPAGFARRINEPAPANCPDLPNG